MQSGKWTGDQAKANGAQLLQDMGQVLSNLLGTIASGRGQVRTQAKEKLELLLQHVPLVSREEFDALHAMLQKARMEQEALKARLDALEGKPVKSASQRGTNNPVNEKLKKSTAVQKKSSSPRNKTGKR